MVPGVAGSNPFSHPIYLSAYELLRNLISRFLLFICPFRFSRSPASQSTFDKVILVDQRKDIIDEKDITHDRTDNPDTDGDRYWALG